ncbi:MAG: AmmeMemoRadiSam system protein B [Candidatus Nomurabacteria bacterium]|nr:MAG: AmmeMemoRadiSam system protein B [Candidatus Nomurabacteria bacterium]
MKRLVGVSLIVFFVLLLTLRLPATEEVVEQLPATKPTIQKTLIPINDQPEFYIDYGLSFIKQDQPMIDSKILLVPHHLLPVKQIGEAFASAPNEKRVILLAPDHFSGCPTFVCTTEADFSYQAITIPTVAAEQSPITKSDFLFTREHAIRGLLPFLKKRWPESELIPITIKADADVETIDRLAQWILTELQRGDTYLVATIDLSHYLPAYLADIHDLVTIRDLLTPDPERWKPMEIDNPPIARIVQTLSRDLGLKGSVQSHTNSLRLVQSKKEREGTSHVIIRYSNEGEVPEEVSTILYTDPSRKIYSIEDRYYWGFDQIITTSTKQDWAEVITPTTTTRIDLPFERIDGLNKPVIDSVQAR